MFIVDALLGNFDRHNGNWGFLYDEATDETEIAPIYDCGSCLLPQADEKVMQKVLSDDAELHARVYQFPTSAIKLNGRKINYYDFLLKTADKDCAAALKRIVPQIDVRNIESFIAQVPAISDLQKEFYMRYLNARFDLIILPAWKRGIEQ